MDSNLFVFVSKLLPALLYPLGLACFLVLFGMISTRRRSWASAALTGALLLLWLGGSRWVALSLVRSLESRYPSVSDSASAPAIVVLGGGMLPAVPPRPNAQLGMVGDRLLQAARLYLGGKAQRVVVSGGHLGWSRERSPESTDMAEILALWGVPRTAILEETQSRNTYENAVETRRLLAPEGINRVLLVTSAIHMPRAVALFRCAGFEVVPAPADFLVADGDLYGFGDGSLEGVLLALVPDAESLEYTTRALKEYLGLLVSGLRGVSC